MSWLDRIAARAGVERDWNTGVNTSAQTSAPADDSAWKYISAGDIKGLADYTNREYNYHSIPYLGQVIGHTANNATMGLANAAQFLGADSVSNYLYEKGKEGEAQLPEYREPELSLSYVLDPNGLLSTGAMVAGSMLSMAPVAALAPVGGIAAVAARLAGNVPKVGGLLSNFAPGAVRWATTGPIEAMMEGGGTEREMLENGASREAANAAAWDVFKKNAALLTATNALEGGLLSKLGVKTPTFKNPVANGISRAAAYAPQTAAEAVLQGYEEGAQEGIQAAAMGNGANTATQILNPSNWTEGQWDAAKMGFAGGLPLVGGMAIARRLGNRVSRPSSDAPMQSSGDENIDALIAQAAEKYGVPVNLLHSIAQTESEYNQDARSEAGAIGMMQLMPDTAAGLGVDPNDLAGNIEGGAKYMRELLDTFDGDLEKAVAAYNAGPNAVKKHGGIPPYAQTQDYVRKVLGGLDGYDTSVPQRMRNLVDDAAPYIGVTMDNATQGCVEAVTKIGAKSCPFLAQELENGVVNVDRLVEHAGDRVIPFDPNQLEEGDVIVYGDASDPQRHVVLYDGKGGYIGNSTEQNKVVQGEDYNQMGDWTPTKIIKTGAQFGSRGMRSVVAPVIPDFTGLIADEKNIAVTQEAIQNLINTDRLTPAQHAAILQAAEMIRDMPVGDGTDAAADAEHVNEWQSLIDRKDIKGIFEKDPQKVVQTMTNLGKEQRAQKTRAAIENQQQIEETKQAIAAVQTQANTQPVQAAQKQGDQSVQQIVPEQSAQPMMDGQVSPTVPYVGDMQATTQTSTPIQPENVMQMPQEVPPVSDAFAAGLERGAADAVQTAQTEQPHTPVSQEELAGILSKVQQWEQPLLSIPEYVAARNRQDWAATAQIARAANVPGVAQFYDTLMEHGSRNATNITPYAPQQSAPPTAVPSTKASVPVVGVRPNVPTRLPDNIEERRALGRSLGRFMTDNKINIPKQLGYDLAGGRGKAIQVANDKITAWEEKRAGQEAYVEKNGDVNTSHVAQEDAQVAQSTVDNRMLAQRGTEPKNGSHIVREKSAQNQVNKKAADKGGVSEGASVSTEPESLNEPSETPSINAPSSTSTISSEAEENKEKPLSENEREAVKGLSSDAKNVYQMVRDKLTGMKNKKVARAASAGAVLLARHADIIARKVRATLGTPFTAMDYYRTWFDLRYGGEMGGFTQALNAGVNLNEQVPVVDITAALPQKKMSNKDVLNFLRGIARKQNTITSADGKAVFDILPKDVRHITFSSNKKASSKEFRIRKAGVLSIQDLLQNAVLVESTPNRKTGKKPNVRAYHRFYVPVCFGNDLKTLRIVAEEQNGAITLQPTDVNLYDIIVEQKAARTPAGISPVMGSANGLSTISIRDMLTGVKDADGNVYAQRRAEMSDAERKEIQFRIIEETNPMHDDIHTGIRSVDDILTAKEAFGTKVDEDSYAYPDFTEADGKAALKNGEVTIYSSYPIAPGVFVTPSKMQAQDYAGSGKVYSKKVSVKDIAWIHSDEGQYAPIETESFNQSAWHGTPHDFDGFDLGAIGTGEGAQVHGWGLYFAKERKVSEGYKRQLTRNNIPEITLDGVPFGELTRNQQRLLAFFDENGDESDFGKQRDEAIALVQGRLNKATRKADAYQPVLSFINSNPHPTVEEVFSLLPEGAEKDELKMVVSWGQGGHKLSNSNISGILATYKQSVNVIKEQSALLERLNELDVSRIKIKQANRGKLYEVDIPDSDVLLDEQKPFDEQPKFVQKNLEALVMQRFAVERMLDRLSEKDGRYDDVFQDYCAYLDSSESEDADVRKAAEEKKRAAEEGVKRLLGTTPLARAFLRTFADGREIYLMLGRIYSAYQNDKAASLALNEVGIKGITYVGGRDGRCFVVFDDKAISIIEKFNQQMNEIVKGTTQDIRDGQRIVSLFEEADESTFLHEMGHLFLLDLERLADMSQTSTEELQTVRKWAAWSDSQAAEYKKTPFEAEFADLDAKIRAALKKGDGKTANKLKRQWEHERFARGFERYLQYGEAPTKGLRALFAKFRAFLQRVYQAFTGTGGRATPEVEAVMARMISIEDSSDLSAYPQGKKTAVYTDSGKKLSVQYRVVSADDLIASHDAGALEINPGYPVALQPRDRERVMMRQQVTGMANTLRPEDLADGRNLNQGAPLIRNDGVVLNGNGRTIAIQRAQARNKERATAYRNYLVENAATFGFSKEEVESVKNPVLVREVQGDISDGLMQDIIGSTTGGARMGASEAAQQDAEKITYAMLDAYVPNDKGDLTTAANRSFVADILHKLVGKDEMNAYLDKDGHVNADGIQRVKRALFALAYGDDELIAKMAESTDDDIRNVSNGLMSAAPMVARLSVKKGAPYVKELQDAIGASVKQLDTLRRSGESVKDYLGAQALFSEHEDSAEMRAILSFLEENKRSGKRIATYFSNVAKTLDEMETPSGNELFDAEMPSLMDVLEGAKNLVESGGQDSLFGEYMAKEADALYEKAARKFPGITDKEVADHVREAIQLTLDFGHGKGEIKGVAGTTFGKEKLPSERGSVSTDDYRSSDTIRDKKTEKELKRGKIYGLGITRKLVNDGAVSLVGQKAESVADIAEIAQVLRHHGYEKFHYVYTDDAGNVKFHETVTARLPANAPIFMPNDVYSGRNSREYLENAQKRIAANMNRFGATKFYFIHNHPSGDPTPSREDFDVTKALLGGEDTAISNAFGGHVILDHNIYEVIGKTGVSTRGTLKNSYQADYSVPEKPHAVLGTVVTGEDVTQRIADLYGTESETTAFYLTTKGVVRSVQKIHDNFKDVDGATQMNYLRYCARSVGGFRVILATSDKKLYDSIKERINSGRDEGILDVVLMENGRAFHPEEKIRSNRATAWFGQQRTSVRAEQVLERKHRYGSNPIAGTVSELLQHDPSLKKAALEYGAKDERGKVTFADEERKQEFIKVAKALLSAGERRTSARRQESLKEMLDGIRLIPPTRVSPRKRVLVDWGREMGVPVVFFKGDPSLHGFHQDGVTFLNVDSEITPQWTFWHEAMHWMKANNPDIYSDLVQEIHGVEGFTKAQLDAYRREIGAPEMSDADVIEEMLADALPDVKRRVPLLRDIGKRDTGLVQRVVAWIRDVMRRFHDHFHTPQGGLTSAQRVAMTRAFGNLVGSIRDAEGKAIFRIENEGARITLGGGKPLPTVKYSLDNRGKEGDNEDGRNLGEARKEAICSNVLARMKTRVHEMLKQGVPFAEIQKELEDENSTSREEALRVFKTQWNIFNSPRVNKRNIVERITKREDFTDDEVNELFEQYKSTMKEMLDYGGFIYKEAAFQQRGNREFLAGVHSWRDLERANARHGGSAHTGHKNSLNTKHLESQGAFSMPKFSANTSGESPKGNFKLLKDRIRSLVGVAPADNLELPGRVQRTVTLSPKDLEKRIRERWIQEKNIISKEKQKDGKITVTYYPDTHDVGYADYVKSVRQVAKRNPFVKVLYDLAHKAMKKQEKLRNEFGKSLKEFAELMKNEKDMEKISVILWQGDAEGKAFTDAELRGMGANERVIKAYRLVRRELEKAYKMLRDAQTQVKTRSQTLAPESVETFKKNHWIEDADVISAVPRADGMVLLTWRGGRTYDVKGKTMDAEALELMKKDENVNVTSAIPKGDGTFSVNYVERIKPVFRRTGYMPHFFHEWMIYEKYKDPKTGEERYTSVASGRTMNEAVKIGNEIAAKNKDKQYVLRPKGFDLDTENAVVVGDMDFAQMSRKLAESTEISLADARSLLLDDAGMSLKSRHRFFGSLLERKDGKGFDQDVQWVLAHYLNGAARYIAMEDFKPAAISMYERFFGRFDDDLNNLTARYCKNLINDVNGNPRGVEVWLNELIKKTPIGKYVADSFGDRVALALNGELSTWNAITKLGLFNFASAAVNFSQFINVGAALNDYGYAMKGLKKALHPSAMDEKIIEASGLLNDINMADDNGGYTQRRGGKVRGIYSALKKGGEWTLIPFQKADTLMRKAAVLGAYYQGIEQKGMKTAPGDELSAEALDYAQEINDDANFDYSSANAPNMLRAGSVVTQQLFQFQKYPIMQFEFMYNILKNGTRGQKVRMLVPYVLFCGIGGSIPFGELFNQLFSFLFGIATGDDEDIARDIKAEILRWAGKDPVKKSVAETALYGVLAPTFGLDISGRIGMSNAFSGEFYGQKPDSVGSMVAQQLGGPMAATAINVLHQAHEGNPIEALKAVSPALGNMAQAYVGESRTTRHRVNARYDSAYDKIAHALGFRSVEESKNAFIMNYEYEQKSKLAQTRREAIQEYIADPSDANRRTINALGITERQIKEARIQQERTALERAREGRPKTSNKSGASRRRKEEAKRETLYDTLDDE